jgi:hypothetical protein
VYDSSGLLPAFGGWDGDLYIYSIPTPTPRRSRSPTEHNLIDWRSFNFFEKKKLNECQLMRLCARALERDSRAGPVGDRRRSLRAQTLEDSDCAGVRPSVSSRPTAPRSTSVSGAQSTYPLPPGAATRDFLVGGEYFLVAAVEVFLVQ